MSNNSEGPANEEVGYGRPPKSGQFKKGQSGNPNGRPKKPDPAEIDLNAMLPSEVQVGGLAMDTREAELWRLVEQATKPKGPLKAIHYLIARFEEYGAMKAPKPKRKRIELPSMTEVPWAVQRVLLMQRNPPPWTPSQLKKAKAEYLESRSEGDRVYDKAAGNEEWLKT